MKMEMAQSLCFDYVYKYKTLRWRAPDGVGVASRAPEGYGKDEQYTENASSAHKFVLVDNSRAFNSIDDKYTFAQHV